MVLTTLIFCIKIPYIHTYTMVTQAHVPGNKSVLDYWPIL